MMTYNISLRILKFNGVSYRAVSGPFGKGALQPGDYEVKVRNIADEGLGKAFCAGGVCFFIPIRPTFTYDRGGLGIHPDGNVPGTEGCIGVSSSDAKPFWDAWKNMHINSRPIKLQVLP